MGSEGQGPAEVDGAAAGHQRPHRRRLCWGQLSEAERSSTSWFLRVTEVGASVPVLDVGSTGQHRRPGFFAFVCGVCEGGRMAHRS